MLYGLWWGWKTYNMKHNKPYWYTHYDTGAVIITPVLSLWHQCRCYNRCHPFYAKISPNLAISGLFGLNLSGTDAIFVAPVPSLLHPYHNNSTGSTHIWTHACAFNLNNYNLFLYKYWSVLLQKQKRQRRERGFFSMTNYLWYHKS